MHPRSDSVLRVLLCALVMGTLLTTGLTSRAEDAPTKILNLPETKEDQSLTLSDEVMEPQAEILPGSRVKNSTNVAVLQSLNKVTARASELHIKPNSIERFGNLEILMIRCWKSPPEEKPEAAALLQIWEKRPNEMRQQLFLGWMFASSPAISALEHAVYDIRVLDCISQAKTKY